MTKTTESVPPARLILKAPVEHRLYLLAMSSLLRRRDCVLFHSLEPLTSTRGTWFKFRSFQQAVFIGVDQSADGALHRRICLAS